MEKERQINDINGYSRKKGRKSVNKEKKEM